MAVAKKKNGNEKALEMNEILLRSNCYVVADIETTGFSPVKGGRIIEVAGVKIKDGKIVGEFSQLINPEQKIYPKITELTGINNEMVSGKPVFGQVLPEFYRFIGDAVFVAHNKSFDWDRYLLHYFKKVGIIADNASICTKILAKMYRPNLPAYGLEDICKDAGVEITNHHRALDDSMALAHVFLKYLNTYAPLYQPLPVLNAPIQPDLFSLPMDKTQMKKEVPSASASSYKIKRVSYWEKDLTKQRKMQRIYVLTTMGSVYFDIPTKSWYNKDVKSSLNFEEIEQKVLSYLKLHSNDELCQYRNGRVAV
ncbi:DNA polymerase-3 subunit alpha (Gram-positive type) [Paenibacillus sp. 1182]|uniref:3'-5' exonuclease n=1 Tax=Paenibacillus sp. 1182 TaxID=2806565 RepID=UPI001AE7ACB0|nr:3'-5' exonuclease [Paenibacillus sp. 1182]MBP1308673.1 DNA polymerase-3 subunit alpha (Gram-positive type) [Paenibacillus sp. 1182]